MGGDLSDRAGRVVVADKQRQPTATDRLISLQVRWIVAGLCKQNSRSMVRGLMRSKDATPHVQCA